MGSVVRTSVSVLAFVALCTTTTVALADETGVSLWLPGTFGSLSAVPAQPGFQWATTYYHVGVSAGAGQAFEQGGRVETGLRTKADLALLSPSYAFAAPILGGRLAVGVTSIVGPVDTAISGTLTGPRGNTVAGSRSDSLSSSGDLYPIASLKWNAGTNNYMAYVTGDVPVGSYDPSRIANVGIGHGAADAGAGYTYFDPTKGREFSAVGGFTYNFENPSTAYRSSVDLHLDLAASQFLSKQLFVGAVGYAYDEVGCGSGGLARLGCFQSRVFGAGPQVGYLFPVGGEIQGAAILKGYKEFKARNRSEGFDVWFTLAFSPAAPASAGLVPPPSTR